MNFRRLAVAGCLLLFVIPMHAAVSMAFDGNVVHVAGVTPRGQAVIIAVTREGNRAMITRLDDTQQLLADSDGDGSIDYDFKRPIPPRSVWAVVDLASGESAIAAPGQFPTGERPLPGTFVKNVPADEFDTLISDHLVMHILWVRPGNGGGAWFMRAADGAANDADGQPNGRAILSTAAFLPLGDSAKAPKKLKKGDVLVLLDPFTMTSSRGVIAQ